MIAYFYDIGSYNERDYTNIISRISGYVKVILVSELHDLSKNRATDSTDIYYMTTKKAHRSVFIIEPISGARIYKLYYKSAAIFARLFYSCRRKY